MISQTFKLLTNTFKFFLWIIVFFRADILLAQADPHFNFGAKGGFNYSNSGMRYSVYNGAASPNLSLFASFYSKPWLTWLIEPGYSSVSFRQQASETHYNGSWLDLNLLSSFSTSPSGSDLNFLLGFRPSILVAYETQALDNGSVTTVNDPNNLNKKGRFDLGLVMGLSLNLSSTVSLELCYNHSFTDQTLMNTVQGRPSTIEMGLRINALGLQESTTQRAAVLKNQLNIYKRGGLMVMLTTPDSSTVRQVALANDSGFNAINYVDSIYLTNNLNIMKEFNNEFNFSKVYFFFDKDANKLSSGNAKGIFLNRLMQPDSTINPELDDYFIASFCVDESAYTGKSQMGLYVYAKTYAQLGRPFNPNLMSFMGDGNPATYFNMRKLPVYNISLLRQKIRKLNARLLRNLED